MTSPSKITAGLLAGIIVLASCGGDDDYDEGFRDGSRQSAVEGGWTIARAEIEAAIQAGWPCEITRYDSIQVLDIRCES